MKKSIFVAVALVALVASSVAVAHLKSGNVTAVSATLSATTTVERADPHVHLCRPDHRGHDRPLDRHLDEHDAGSDGPVELHVHSVYNTTKKLGWVDGRLKIRAADDR